MRKLEKVKFFVLGAVVMALFFNVVVPVVATVITRQIDVTYNDIKIKIDEQTITPKDANGNIVEPFIYNGTTYLPVRAIGEAFGGSVSWDGETSTVNILNEISAKRELYIDLAKKSNFVPQAFLFIEDCIMIMGQLLSKSYSLIMVSPYAKAEYQTYMLTGIDNVMSSIQHLKGYVANAELRISYIDREIINNAKYKESCTSEYDEIVKLKQILVNIVSEMNNFIANVENAHSNIDNNYLASSEWNKAEQNRVNVTDMLRDAMISFYQYSTGGLSILESIYSQIWEAK